MSKAPIPVISQLRVRITQDIYIKTVQESTVTAMNLIGEEMEKAKMHRRCSARRINR